MAGHVIAKYGGRSLVRGGNMDVSLARTVEWHDSPEHSPLRPIRQANSRSRIAMFEGVTSPAG